jgi:hypothetical protein
MLSLGHASDRPYRGKIQVFSAGGPLLSGIRFERSGSGALKGSLLVSRLFLNRHALSMTQRWTKIRGTCVQNRTTNQLAWFVNTGCRADQPLPRLSE